MAVSAYATVDDLALYLAPASPATGNNAALWQQLLNNASRVIDQICGQYFYQQSTGTKYFNGDGTRSITTKQPFYAPTSIKLAYFENQPIAQWTDIMSDGSDGVTPPSNFWLFPANPLPDDQTGNTSLKPFWGFDLATIPKTGSVFLPAMFPGYRTVAITATWGWPVVPDPIKHLTLKMAARAWRSKDAGWSMQVGSADIGTQDFTRFLDREDLFMLRSTYWRPGF